MYIYLSERIHLLMLKLLPHMNLYTIKFTFDKEDRQQGRTEKNERRDKQRKKTT